MTVNELKESLELTAVCLPDGDREVTGCYIGDLLSWVMGAAKSGDAWITIMSNINIVAVAALCDTACIILSEGVTLDEEVKRAAEERDINVLSAQKSAFALATAISEKLV
ncbi:MAG: hypothetical protein J6V50_00140 [Clostridia bacterium]|nr:hypothetical protein [Clostridia bacterium]